ncbi:MAG: hypothetical protein ACREIP_20020, partial [Alphaproteobacteria bacterium]
MAGVASANRFRLKRWTGEFADRETERAYRVATFRDGRWLNRLVVGITAVSILARIGTDYWLIGFSPSFWLLLTVRLSLVGLLALVIPLTALPPRIALADAGMFGIQLAISLVFSATLMAVPAAHLAERLTAPSVTVMLILMAQYFFIANRLRYLVMAGVACSLAYFATNFATGRLAPSAMVLEVGVHLVANVFGTVAAYRTGVLRRRQYALLTRQKKMNRKLEAQGRNLEATAQELE